MRTFCDSVNFVVRLCEEEVTQIMDLDKTTGPTLSDVMMSDPDILEVIYDESGPNRGIRYTLNSRANTLNKRNQIEKWVKGYLS